jgi:MFS family permease
MSAYLRVLRTNPDFARLWWAQVISLTGDWFNTIALSTLVVAYSPNNEGLAISALLLARFIPPMLISPISGVLVDRFDRKRLIIWSNLLRAGIVLLMLITTTGEQWLWLVYLLTVLQFTLSAVFEPAQNAMIPNTLPPEDLVVANTLNSTTWSVILALGAAVGGLVSSAFGTETALIIDAVTFGVATLLVSGVKHYRSETPVRQQHKEQTTFADGLRYLRQTPEVASVLLVKLGTSLGNVDTLVTIYATQLFVLGDRGQLSLGIMYSVYGFGALAGPLIMNRWNDGRVYTMRRLIIIGFVLTALGWLTMSGASSLLLVCIALLIRAVGGSVNWTYSTVIVQKSVPDLYRGRVFALDMAGFYFATVLSTFLHGNIIDRIGTENVSWVAFGTMIISLIPMLLWIPIVRWLESRRPLAVTGD